MSTFKEGAACGREPPLLLQKTVGTVDLDRARTSGRC